MLVTVRVSLYEPERINAMFPVVWVAAVTPSATVRYESLLTLVSSELFTGIVLSAPECKSYRPFLSLLSRGSGQWWHTTPRHEPLKRFFHGRLPQSGRGGDPEHAAAHKKCEFG